VDLKAYYKKIREVGRALTGDYQLLVSLATPDGGKAGVITEVATAVASRLIVETKARKATDEEAKRYREEQKAKREAQLKAAVSQSLQTQLARGLEAWLGKTVNVEPLASEPADKEQKS
jgi:putative exporter of polyketide antibiotics